MSIELLSDEQEQQVVEHLRASRQRIDKELSKTIVGQKDVVQQLLISLLAGGHCLITGAPGLAKTLLVRSVARIFHLNFQRIQFTPDLMPSDITGTEILEQRSDGRREMIFVKGADFRKRDSGGRNQSHAAENASFIAGGDARTSGNGSRQALCVGRAVLCSGDAESD